MNFFRKKKILLKDTFQKIYLLFILLTPIAFEFEKVGEGISAWLYRNEIQTPHHLVVDVFFLYEFLNILVGVWKTL